MKFMLCTLKKMVPAMIWVLAILVVSPVRSAHGEGGFSIERPKLGMGTFYEYEEEKRTFQESETKAVTHDMREYVTLQTEGWAGYPNLMGYRLSVTPEWRQETFRKSLLPDGPEQTDDRDTSVLAYNAKATFFEQKPLSLDLFSDRSTRKIDLSNQEDTDIETRSWGSRLGFTSAVLPIMLSFTDRNTDQTGFYDSDEDRKMVRASIRHLLKRSISTLNILRDDTRKTIQTVSDPMDVSSKTTTAEFTNTFLFSGDERVRLDSLLYSGREEYDDIRIDTRMVTENFYWSITQNLLTQYTANFNRREAGDVTTEEKALDGLLTHRLGDSLTTTLGAGAASNDFTGGSEDRYRSKLGFDYRRSFPGGSIDIKASGNYQKTQRTGAGKQVPTETRLVLSNGEEALLAADFIDLDTIVVTSTDGSVVYTENIDYQVSEAGSGVRISRSLLGAIEDGQEVVVHYAYRVDSAYDDARFGQDYRFDLSLGSFMSLTGVHRSLDQRILSGDPPANRMDDAENSLYLRFVAGGSETRLEYRNMDRKSGDSTITKSVRELIDIGVFRATSLNFSGEYGKRDFTDTHESETFYTYGADLKWRPIWWCDVSLIGRRSDISGDRQDMGYSEISPKILVTYGVWKASLAYRVSDQKDRAVDNRLWRQRLYFTVTRALW